MAPRPLVVMLQVQQSPDDFGRHAHERVAQRGFLVCTRPGDAIESVKC